MRLLWLTFLMCIALQAQRSGLKEYLALTPAQTTQVLQLNSALDQFTGPKQQRIGQIHHELDQEYAKASFDPLALGQRYLELDSISREMEAQRKNVQAGVFAVLTDTQKGLIQQLSQAVVQTSLINDVRCAYLADGSPGSTSTAGIPGALLFGVTVVDPLALSLYVPSTPYGCAVVFPISVRSFLSLSDAQVSAIQNLIAAYQNLTTRKQARIADVQAELREETAKPVPDPVALGVRYAELNEISQELQQADTAARQSARALLTPTQSAALANLMKASALSQYIAPAESCHFLSPPPGILGSYDTGGSCANYF